MRTRDGNYFENNSNKTHCLLLYPLASQISKNLSGLLAPHSSAPSRCLVNKCCLFLTSLQLPPAFLYFSGSLWPTGFSSCGPLTVLCPVSVFVCLFSSPPEFSTLSFPSKIKKCQTSSELSRSGVWGGGSSMHGRRIPLLEEAP